MVVLDANTEGWQRIMQAAWFHDFTVSCKKGVCHQNAEVCKSAKIGTRGTFCKSKSTEIQI